MAALPEQVKDFYILPVIPAKPANFSPQAAIRHILYIGPHKPRVPTAESSRSLLVVNVPVDSTTTHFRALFAEQLGGVRVERVDFDHGAETAKADVNNEETPGDGGEAKRGKKRKRRTSQALLRGNMPDTWDRQLHKSGSTAVLIFVDRRSMEQALRAVEKSIKAARAIHWGGDAVEAKLPASGSKRTLSPASADDQEIMECN